jgi:predicted permease
VAGVLVIVLYLATPVLGALFGGASPMNFMIYLGLLLTAVFTSVVMYLASTGGETE